MSDQLCSNKRVQHSNPHINITSRSFLIKRHIVSTYFWSCCVCLCTCFCISSVSLQCLIGVGVPGCRAVTLMALLIEAFLSPAWLNSNGLRFDFPTGTRQERANNNTHRHTPAGYLGERGACREEVEEGMMTAHRHHQMFWDAPYNDTDRETWSYG